MCQSNDLFFFSLSLSHLCALYTFLEGLDVGKLFSGDPWVTFRAVMHQHKPGDAPQETQSSEQIEGGGPAFKKVGGTQPSTDREAKNGAEREA